VSRGILAGPITVDVIVGLTRFGQSCFEPERPVLREWKSLSGRSVAHLTKKKGVFINPPTRKVKTNPNFLPFRGSVIKTSV
jgi:hypothetical protein